MLKDSVINGQEIRIPISLADLKRNMMDHTIEIKELWFPDTPDQNKTQVRVNFNYMFSKRMMYDMRVMDWQRQLIEDCVEYHNIQAYLE